MLLGLIFAALLTIDKAMLPSIHADELYFWFVTLKHGLVRRSLVGTMLSPLLAPLGPISFLHALQILHVASLCGVIAAIIFLAKSARLPPLAALLFLLSPFFGLLAYHLGYPDDAITLCVILGTYAARAGSPSMILLSLLAAAFTHEIALVILIGLLPLAFLARADFGRRQGLMLAMGSLACLALVVLNKNLPPALAADIAAGLKHFGLPDTEAQTQAPRFLTQNSGGAFAHMRDLWRQYALNGAFGIVYAGLPALIVALTGAPRLHALSPAGGLPRRGAAAFLFAVACIAPLSLLLVAFDLSRLAAYTMLSTTMALSLLPPGRAASAPRARAGLLAACAVYLVLPVLDLHMDNGRAIKLRLAARVCAWCVQADTAVIDWYNRDLPEATRRQFDNDPLRGNAPD